jgi:hypothetical protein
MGRVGRRGGSSVVSRPSAPWPRGSPRAARSRVRCAGRWPGARRISRRWRPDLAQVSAHLGGGCRASVKMAEQWVGGLLPPPTHCASAPAGSERIRIRTTSARQTAAVSRRGALGSTHDTSAARADQIIEAAANAYVELIAGLGHHEAGGKVRTPVKRKLGRGLSSRNQRASREHAHDAAPANAASHSSKPSRCFAACASALSGSPRSPARFTP